LVRPLTILACPKPFRGQLAVTQRNAIASWTRLRPRPQVLLFGDDPETKAVSEQLGLRHMSGLERNASGTPLLRDIIGRGQAHAGGGLLCFINSDIILTSDFLPAVNRVAASKSSFLMIGERRDLDFTQAIDFTAPEWDTALRIDAMRRGRPHGPYGIDYFVFSSGLFDPIPPLLIGRAGVDNWLVFRARSRWAAVVDASAAVLAIHQNHDYSHHPAGRQGVFEGEEAQHNLREAGGHDRLFWINDHTHTLTPNALKLDLSAAQLRRHWDRMPVTAPPSLRAPVHLLRRLWLFGGKMLRAVGLRRALVDLSSEDKAR
jgi:hypothetical protein